MRFTDHSNLEGSHAYLSASQYSWLRYDDDKFDEAYLTKLAAQRGTRLHEFAAEAIKLKQELPDTGQTLNQYVNDCIGWRMRTEQVLMYSQNCFGTADAIWFGRKPEIGMVLLISDLKTGKNEAKVDQLLIYAALFCLEYNFKPADLTIELRIYQNDEVRVYEPEQDDILPIMDKIVYFDRRIEDLNAASFV